MPRTSDPENIQIVVPVKLTISRDTVPAAVKARAKAEMRNAANQVRFEISDAVIKAAQKVVSDWLRAGQALEEGGKDKA